MTYGTKNSTAAEKAAFIKTAFEGLDDPGNDNASRVKTGAEAFPLGASAEAPGADNSTEALGNASENAPIAANLDPPDDSLDMRSLAVWYAKWGPCPTPLRPNGKAPILPEFNKRATNDPAKAHAMFSDVDGSPRDCNIGLVNGTILPNGRELFIVDPDTKEQSGGPGVVSFHQRIKDIEAAIGCPLPRTVTSRSVTRGYRGGALLFSAPRGTYRGPKQGFLPHVDIPIEAVVPGSTIDGKAYTWEPGHAPWERDIAEALQELIDAYHQSLGSKSKPSGAEGVDGQRQPPAPVIELDRPDMIEAASKWSREVAPHAGDGRSGTCYVVSYLFSHFALSPETAVDVLMDGDDSWNATKTKYEWGYDEDDANGGSLIRLAHDLYARRTKAPGSSARANIDDVFEVAEGVEAPAAADPDNDGLEIISADERGEKERQAKAESEAEPGTNPAGGINFRDARVKRAPYVMKGWLHRGETVQWFGPPGAGKSASLLSVMLAVAAAPPEGAMLAGCRVKRGLAIFAAYERAGETQDRLAAARKWLSLPDDLPFVLLTRPPLLKDGKAAESVIETIRHYEKLHGIPCSTYAIDTLTAARPGMGQSDDAEMSSLMNHLQHIRDTVGCCLPFIHHPTKANANNPRGSGVTTGHVDKEVAVNKGRIRMQKNNAGPDAEALDLKIESVLMGEDEDGDPVSVAYASVKPSRVGVEKAFDGVDGSSYVPAGLRQAYDALKSVAAGRPDGVVSTNDWFDQIDADAKTARLKKPVRATKNNHKDALVDGGFIAFEGTGFWRLK
jgi:AAA domain/Bifunctional DNA primase/polymerase, N-terminal